MILIDYVKYNYWANKQVCEFIKKLNDSQLFKEINSSFKTIFDTAIHINDAETIWLLRLQGKSLTNWPSETVKREKEVLINELLSVSKDFVSFLADKHEAYFKEDCSFSTTKGIKHVMPVNHIIQHVFNHSTFHRGQLITMLRQVGYEDVASTDFITWSRLGKPE